MPRRLPPLNPTRVFEVVARVGSFSRAAAELNVTTAAVSLQVKALESYLGFPLFVRRGRSMGLTNRAEACLPDVATALDLLADVASRWQAMADVNALRLRVSPAFAAFWLIPRLPRFRARHPAIKLTLATLPASEVRLDPDCDVAIGPHDLGFRGSLIFADVLVPMCSPRYLREAKAPLLVPADLRFHSLLHIDYSAFRLEIPDWPEWLLRFGVEDLDAGRGLHFDCLVPALGAATDGLGLVLAPRRLMAREIAEGHLCCALDVRSPAEKGYFMSCEDEVAGLPRIDAFRHWVLLEAAREEAPPGRTRR